MLRNLIITAAALVTSAFISGAATAQTPDAIPPAQEGVCDVLLGGTPGLYGLCVAYCEAQDLNEMFQEIKAGGKPGEKILANYRRKMKPGDPDIPCIVSSPAACPCYNINICDPNDFICTLNIMSVDEAFTGRSCDLSDSCFNTANSAQDVCFSSETVGTSLVQVSAAVSADGTIGSCLALTTDDGTNSSNGFLLDGPTAQQCIDELNAYDGNGPGDGTVAMCMLAN